jgi:hypothetical protein
LVCYGIFSGQETLTGPEYDRLVNKLQFQLQNAEKERQQCEVSKSIWKFWILNSCPDQHTKKLSAIRAEYWYLDQNSPPTCDYNLAIPQHARKVWQIELDFLTKEYLECRNGKDGRTTLKCWDDLADGVLLWESKRGIKLQCSPTKEIICILESYNLRE